MRPAAVVLLLATLPLLTAGRACSTEPLNVLLITLDTTRADRLTPYGLMDASMPALERLAREGIVFDQASTVAPLTLPAHTSLFTGRLPPAHGIRDNSDPRLAGEHVTLAEVLQARGYRTAAFVGSAVLDADRGLAQGFAMYRSAVEPDDRPGSSLQRRGDAVVSDAIAWLGQAPRSPFLLWTHLYDPHRPYDPPEPYRSRFSDPYIAEIAFADAQIGRLIDELDRRELLDRTLVIVAGDHGESLGEHGERNHGIFVYESVLRVPLMMRVPGLPPSRIAALVRLTDVMPTLLELVGVEAPTADGISVAGMMTGAVPDLELEAYAESRYPLRFGWSPLGALRDGRFKVIDAPRPELYDLSRDPFELTNLYEKRRPLADAMIRRLRALQAAAAETSPAEHSEVPGELRQRLSALGYASGSAREPPESGRDLPDPKDCFREEPPSSPAAQRECFARAGR
ncbi:MAG TPA: sulfatase [Vicinamibacterales bacterium]|nr:sulfatase [Vicinamibacterales bacterium]